MCEVSGFVYSTIVAVLSAVYCGGLLRYGLGKFVPLGASRLVALVNADELGFT